MLPGSADDIPLAATAAVLPFCLPVVLSKAAAVKVEQETNDVREDLNVNMATWMKKKMWTRERSSFLIVKIAFFYSAIESAAALPYYIRRPTTVLYTLLFLL